MDKRYQQLKKRLGARVVENQDLARYTTFKIGGPADLFYEARTEDELVGALREARRLIVPVTVIGGGSNVLVGDRGVRGLVIKNATSRISLRGAKGSLKGGQRQGLVFVEADSGVIFNQLVRFTIEEGLGGLHMHLGLPGTVGGAIFMNSKWTHPPGYVGNSVYQATILTPDGKLTIVPKSYFNFGYDESSLQHTADIVVKVVFALIPGKKTDLWEVANESVAYRRQTQPQGVFSLGCTFRNLTRAQAIALGTPNLTTSAGFLVDHAGLKGTSVGEAQISPVHANFIINRGHARAADVIKLIARAKEQVKTRFRVELVEEIVRLGEF